MYQAGLLFALIASLVSLAIVVAVAIDFFGRNN